MYICIFYNIIKLLKFRKILNPLPQIIWKYTIAAGVPFEGGSRVCTRTPWFFIIFNYWPSRHWYMALPLWPSVFQSLMLCMHRGWSVITANHKCWLGGRKKLASLIACTPLRKTEKTPLHCKIIIWLLNKLYYLHIWNYMYDCKCLFFILKMFWCSYCYFSSFLERIGVFI
jgi:ATP/ADP translocase